MIGYLRGKVRALTPEYVLLEVGGIGYEVVCSGAAFAKLSGVRQGEEGEVYTYLKVSDDGVALFGFADIREKELFLRLTSVQGVGAKIGMAMLSAMRPSEIAEAIVAGDSKRLASVKGLGKKTAERILLELNGKLSEDALSGGGTVRAATPAAMQDEDAVAALMDLGFKRQESVLAVEQARAGGARTLEEVIAAALKGV